MAEHTVVQHSGFGYSGDPTFERGLESRTLTNATETRRVLKAGGLIFPSYEAAEEFAEKAQYPPGYEGMVPAALGSFADLKVDGLAVYVPVREVVG